VAKRSTDGALLVFHLDANLFVFNVTLNVFISIKFKNNNFYCLKWHLSIPPDQDIPLAAKISKYTLRAFVLNFYNNWHFVLISSLKERNYRTKLSLKLSMMKVICIT